MPGRFCGECSSLSSMISSAFSGGLVRHGTLALAVEDILYWLACGILIFPNAV